jgi:hypothetical protein
MLSASCCAIAALVSGMSTAQPAGAVPPASSSATAAPAPQPAGSSLMRTVRSLARDLAPVPAGSIVAALALESDVPAPHGSELVSKAVSLLAGALGPEVRAGRSPVTLDTARTEAASASSLVLLKVQIVQGEIRLSADAYPVSHNVWDRARNPSPGPIAHGYASARIDAEIRSFLVPVPLVATETLRVPLPEPEVLALLCDDIDDDGAIEVVAASRRNVRVGRFRNKQFDTLRKASWDAYASIAPVPWRQPLMSIASPEPGSIDLGSTDRARAVRIDAALAMRAELGGFPVPLPSGSACVSVDAGTLDNRLSPCTSDAQVPSWAEAPFTFDASAAAAVVRADGRLDGVMGVRRVADATVVLRDTQGRTASVSNVGAQIALADLDLDGDPELLASRNVLNASQDALVVRTWSRQGVQERWSRPIPQGISAITACPAEGGGMRAIIVASSTELWLIR